MVINDLWDLLKRNYVLALFEGPIDTQIRDHGVAVRQKLKAGIHTSFFDIIFTRIMAYVIYDLVENELFLINIKERNFTLNWLDFDNSKVEYVEIENLDLEKFRR